MLAALNCSGHGEDKTQTNEGVDRQRDSVMMMAVTSLIMKLGSIRIRQSSRSCAAGVWKRRSVQLMRSEE